MQHKLTERGKQNVRYIQDIFEGKIANTVQCMLMIEAEAEAGFYQSLEAEAEARLFRSQEAEAESGFQVFESRLHEAEAGFGFVPMSALPLHRHLGSYIFFFNEQFEVVRF